MKGSVFDSIMICVALFIIAITVFIGYTILYEFGDKISAMPEFNTTQVDQTLTAIHTMDALLPMVIIGFLIISLIFALVVDNHPAFIGIAIVFMLVAILISVVLGETFLQFSEAPQFAEASSNFTYTLWMMRNLPAIVTLMTIIIIIVLFGKVWRGGGIS